MQNDFVLGYFLKFTVENKDEKGSLISGCFQTNSSEVNYQTGNIKYICICEVLRRACSEYIKTSGFGGGGTKIDMILLKKMGLIAIALAACGDKGIINANNVDVYPQTKKYIIATNTLAAPFSYINNLGEYVGIDVDLLKVIAEIQGFTYQLVPMTFDKVLHALDVGEVEGAMAAISITKEREERYDYSEPYLASGIVMGAAASTTGINSYEDLANKRVAVARGTVAEKFAESIKDKYGFTIVSFDEFPDVYMDVLKGNSQALFEDSIIMGYTISLGLPLKVVSDIEQINFIGFAVPKGKNPDLLEKFNKGLEEVIKSGEYQKIINSYIAY